MSKPSFLTNEDGTTVAEDLAKHLDWALSAFVDPIDVAIATAYFNPAGFKLLANQLEQVVAKGGSVRLLLGAEAVPAHRPPATDEIPSLIDEAALSSRDRLGFTAEADSNARLLNKWLSRENVHVRRLSSEFLHGKAYLVTTHTTSAIVGSSNFTFSGLSRNLELNLGTYEEATVERVTAWFDRIWECSEDYKEQLLELFADRFVEYQPYYIYLRMLLARYGNESSERSRFAAAHLTRFQLDGADRAERILKKWGGVLIADGVGLGKTFVAGELLRRAEENRRQRTLVIAPRAILAAWARYKRQHGRNFDLITYDELVDWEKAVLNNKVAEDPNSYAMVVVDEAHYVRNDNRRNEALHQLLRGRPRKDLVLLTATPVNNRLRDLEQLLSFFVQSKGAFVEQGIIDTSDFFKNLEKQDPDTLSSETLFPILDEVAVRRTRAFIKDFYPNESIVVDGKKVPISFPSYEVTPLEYELKAKAFFRQLDHAVTCSTDCGDPEHLAEWPTFTMARYSPSRYAKNKVSDADRMRREGNIAGLLLSGLLKRFESSIVAFERTCHNMIATHNSFIEAVSAGKVLVGKDLSSFQKAVDDGIDPASYFDDETEGPEDSSQYRTEELLRDIRSDLELLEMFVQQIGEIRADEDTKFTKLLTRLHAIQLEARSDDEKKVIIFSSFADTVDYLHERLTNHKCDVADCCYRGSRVAAVTGSDSRQELFDATSSFAPVSTEKVALSSEDPVARRGSIDLLIATDVLAEGVNLQQARHVINIDLPWNPMRIVQRHGRVSRIGSPHSRVILDCFYPDTDLEKLLNLGSRLRRKIAQANSAVGVEEAPLPNMQATGHVFADDELDASATLDLYGGGTKLLYQADRGVGGTSGEEFRRELERYVLNKPAELRRINRLPLGAGSGRQAEVAATTYVFCTTVDGKDRFAVVRQGRVVTTNTLESLHAARCHQDERRIVTEEDHLGAYEAWLLARDQIYRDWIPLTDAQAHKLVVPKALREAAEFVRSHADKLSESWSVADLTARIEGAYSRRIEKRFQDLAKEELTEEERVQQIEKLVEELDLQEYRESEPLKVIAPDDVEIHAWMVIAPYAPATQEESVATYDVRPTTAKGADSPIRSATRTIDGSLISTL